MAGKLNITLLGEKKLEHLRRKKEKNDTTRCNVFYYEVKIIEPYTRTSEQIKIRAKIIKGFVFIEPEITIHFFSFFINFFLSFDNSTHFNASHAPLLLSV